MMEPSTPAFSKICLAGACSAPHDVDANLLVAVLGLELAERLAGVEERDAAAGDDAFPNRRYQRYQRTEPIRAKQRLRRSR
jgi:hypothetical protein